MYMFLDTWRATLATSGMLSRALAPLAGIATAGAALETFAHAAANYDKPHFKLDDMAPEVILERPFGDLLRFGEKPGAPKLLVVAPMSGHFATLLRGTVAEMNIDHEVYVTDWHDAKLVPLADGNFDLADYVDYVIDFLHHIGPNANVIAVCQPSVPVLAATALMNARHDPCSPSTLTMMGGPIDTRHSPTEVNLLAQKRPYAWFEQNMIHHVPYYYPGGGRKVYPGYIQLSAFMSMNLANHMISHWNMFTHLAEGNQDIAERTQQFYEEYRAVCDMTAEFYLQTIDKVFQRHLLPKGELTIRDEPIELQSIDRTAVFAIEGERDDISGLGQTKAALDLTTHLADDKKQYLMVAGAGHYGIFSGSKWRSHVAPQVRAFITAHA